MYKLVGASVTGGVCNHWETSDAQLKALHINTLNVTLSVNDKFALCRNGCEVFA